MVDQRAKEYAQARMTEAVRTLFAERPEMLQEMRQTAYLRGDLDARSELAGNL